MHVFDSNGAEIHHGDVILDLRGERWVFSHVTRLPEPGRSGKVWVTHPETGFGQTFNHQVFNLVIVNTEGEHV